MEERKERNKEEGDRRKVTTGGRGQKLRWEWTCQEWHICHLKKPAKAMIIIAKFKIRHRRNKQNVIQWYPATNDAEEETKTSFLDSPQHIFEKVKTRVMGDMKANIQSDNTVYDQATDKWWLGQTNETREVCPNFCAGHSLVIGRRLFPPKEAQKANRCHRKSNWPCLYLKKNGVVWCGVVWCGVGWGGVGWGGRQSQCRLSNASNLLEKSLEIHV